MSKVKFSGDWNKKQTKKKSKGIPIVNTFYPLLRVFGHVIYQNLYFVYMGQEAEGGITPRPMIYFRSTRKLNSYLVRAKLYLLEWTVGSCKCFGK